MPLSALLNALPAELRNQVYELALASRDPIRVDPKSLTAHRALLHTCSQTRAEASGLFYSCNTFILPIEVGIDVQQTTGFKWLKAIGPKSAALIKRVEIDFTPAPNFADEPAGPSAHNLETGIDRYHRSLVRNVQRARRYLNALEAAGVRLECVGVKRQSLLLPMIKGDWAAVHNVSKATSGLLRELQAGGQPTWWLGEHVDPRMVWEHLRELNGMPRSAVAPARPAGCML